ncbi:MAG: hypothetical protein JWN07_980 [Hyphomicrobiales bacterium]|nr:hypothetical protein [Hyphomicrobiales bacterium]
MIFRRSSSWLSLLFLAALAAAFAYVKERRPRVAPPTTEAAVVLASRPAPVAVEIDHIVDGDTFRIFMALPSGERISAPVRIRGVDTPEIHGACDAEIRAAREAGRALERLLRGGTVLLDDISSDKYERVLARVVVRGADGRTRNVADALVSGGFGRVYEGRQRAGWCG